MNPLPILPSIVPLVFLNKIEDFAQATLLKSPTITQVSEFCFIFFAILKSAPSRSLEFSSSVGLGGGGCTAKKVNSKLSGVLISASMLGRSSATK
ncbi:hypothetical protein SAMN04488062_12225 [Flavobacterium omnivorum]|uniref:Uncharacterized protein n=1 Tax=Flavobacterium omnivorum TaxID=178355 RepID=A0A1G8HNG4_9FLAO|nr:hypothetical protein SAMN04488062_12225 [Flavobacterium omnivorum]